MEYLFLIIRTIHVLSGALWIGEVVVINVILVPVLLSYHGEMKKQFLISVFPKIFNLASVLAITAVITGMFMAYYSTHGNLNTLLSARWGTSILIGGSLGIALTLFHLFVRHILMKKIRLGKQGNDEKLSTVYSKLKIIPRIGLIMLFVIFLLMIHAFSNGWANLT